MRLWLRLGAADDAHGIAAAGAVPEIAARQGWRRQPFAAQGGELLVSQREEPVAEAVGEQAEAADAHEAFGQHVQEEAAQELGGVERHDARPAAVGIIAPAEADLPAIEGGEAMVADGHAVGVAAEIAQHLLGSAEGRLGVDKPLLPAEPGEQFLEPCRIAELGGGAAAVELILPVELAKCAEELLAEHRAQCGDGQKEERMFGRDPSLMIGRQSAAGDDAVDMVVRQQVGTPGVQDGEEAELVG